MKKIITIIILACSFSTYAQTGIGTANPEAMLHIKNADTNTIALKVEGLQVAIDTETLNALVVDVNGVFKTRPFENSNSPAFFYMPSIVINTAQNGAGLKRNLYLEYIAQFKGQTFVPNTATGGSLDTAPSTKFVKNPSAPATIPVLPNATDLYYYITDYDTTALKNLQISNDGILTYDVVGPGTDYSFVNIVFVVK